MSLGATPPLVIFLGRRPGWKAIFGFLRYRRKGKGFRYGERKFCGNGENWRKADETRGKCAMAARVQLQISGYYGSLI